VLRGSDASPEVAHGYTMTNIGQLARIAARRHTNVNSRARYDIAFSEITLALCEAEQAPTGSELIKIGWRGVAKEVYQAGHLWGYDRQKRREYEVAPGYLKYWTRRADYHPEDRVLESMALRQVMALLTETQRATLTVLAALEDGRLAARALGVPYSRFTLKLDEARRTFRAYWFAPETAPPPVEITVVRPGQRRTHCPQGHELSGDNVYQFPSTPRNRRCKTCRAEQAHRYYLERKAAVS
jgi:hypothetical protein